MYIIDYQKIYYVRQIEYKKVSCLIMKKAFLLKGIDNLILYVLENLYCSNCHIIVAVAVFYIPFHSTHLIVHNLYWGIFVVLRECLLYR